MKLIDSDCYAASGVETFFFPGGEPHARIPKDFGDALLFLKARTWNDFGLGICVIDALKRQGSGEVAVFCPYLPGARQDRSDGQTPLTAHIYLSALKCADYIYTFDTHSSVTERSVSMNYMPRNLELPPALMGGFVPIAPDEGAAHRAAFFTGHHQLPLQCTKVREFGTGKFLGFSMPPLTERGRYLIVDDICDAGGTFNLLAEQFELDPLGRESTLELWVSHGIFSRGLINLHPKISHIWTTESYALDLHGLPRRTVVSLQPVIDDILRRFET